jgi:NADPH:quinone reductase-like Zn-dependent oxidoreductase
MSLALGVAHERIATLADPAGAARLGVRGLRTRRSLAALDELVDLHGSGALRVHVRRRYALHEAAAAHRDIETGHGRGKVVLAIADADAD